MIPAAHWCVRCTFLLQPQARWLCPCSPLHARCGHPPCRSPASANEEKGKGTMMLGVLGGAASWISEV